jgi:hypothetical protein
MSYCPICFTKLNDHFDEICFVCNNDNENYLEQEIIAFDPDPETDLDCFEFIRQNQ